jgi:hypothetical protein
MPDVDPEDLITYEDAAAKYKKTVRWLQSQPGLSVAKIPGDRKHYLLKSEVEKLVQPYIVREAKTEDDEGGANKAG